MTLPVLWLFTDDAIAPDVVLLHWPRVVNACPPGSVALILRTRQQDAAPLLRRTRALLKAAPESAVLVAQRVDVAAATGTGVHLPSRGISAADARSLVRPGALVTRAFHDGDDVRPCTGADAVVVAPVLPPRSHAAQAPVLGWNGLRTAAQRLGAPVVALGGMEAAHVSTALEHGCAGMGMITAAWRAPDPAELARSVVTAWNAAPR